jgi:hypothetical protein
MTSTVADVSSELCPLFLCIVKGIDENERKEFRERLSRRLGLPPCLILVPGLSRTLDDDKATFSALNQILRTSAERKVGLWTSMLNFFISE